MVMRVQIIATFAVLLLVCGGRVQAAEPVAAQGPILTPKPGPAPRINGPKVYGCRPSHPFIYRVPTTGQRPIEFQAESLPDGLKLDAATGIISGTAPAAGEYAVKLSAKNQHGQATRTLKIIAGETLALTPTMGWNHWYAHYQRITDAMIREAADKMVESGMADVGYQYVSIDDCWMNAEANRDPLRVGPARDGQGNLLPNKHFPDMKALTAFIHAKGLKAGIYTSPGPKTCGKFFASYQHEAQDAKQFADWGFDLLKYDWCSYGTVKEVDGTLAGMKRPYQLMGDLLKKQDRDIVFNLCQYGMGNVWQWGESVGGHSWRTSGDLGFELNRITEVALTNASYREFQKPGAWNDPDYIQIGYIGDAKTEGEPRPCGLSADEQYSFMSLWCLMASPLFYSGDMAKLDEFTINVLCNPEMIEVNQDPLGQCGRVVHLDYGKRFMLVKDLEDGSKAVGLFNRGDKPAKVALSWDMCGVSGIQVVRDLWRMKDVGASDKSYTIEIKPHACAVFRLTAVRR